MNITHRPNWRAAVRERIERGDYDIHERGLKRLAELQKTGARV